MGKADSVEDFNREDAEPVDKINLEYYKCYIGNPVRKGFWFQGCVISLDIGTTNDKKEVVLVHVVFADREKEDHEQHNRSLNP